MNKNKQKTIEKICFFVCLTMAIIISIDAMITENKLQFVIYCFLVIMFLVSSMFFSYSLNKEKRNE